MDNNTATQGKTCSCPHHKIIPALVTLFGLAFLLLQLNVLTQSFVDLAWPVLVIIAGLTKLSSGRCKCC